MAEQIRAAFEEAAPKFRNVPGLVRKQFLRSKDCRTAGGDVGASQNDLRFRCPTYFGVGHLLPTGDGAARSEIAPRSSVPLAGSAGILNRV